MRLCFIALLLVCLSCVTAFSDELVTPFLKAVIEKGKIAAISFDPSGRFNFGAPVIKDLVYGAQLDVDSISARDGSVEIKATAYNEEMDGCAHSTTPIMLGQGHKLTVVFDAPDGLWKAGFKMPTWGRKDSGATIKLYRAEIEAEAPKLGELVAGAEIRNHEDNEWCELQFPAQKAGGYALVLSDPVNMIGVYADTKGREKKNSFDNDQLIGGELNWRIKVRKAKPGTIRFAASERSLSLEFAPDARSGFPGMSFKTDWRKDGYSLAPSPFDALWTDLGQWINFEQLKRRPHSTAWLPCSQAVLRAYRDYELDLVFHGQGNFHWFADPDSLVWKGGAPKMTLTVKPPSPDYPSWAPVFECSDEPLGQLTTEFFLSHGANFGVWTLADWKEWQGQILSWQDTRMNVHVRRQLLDMKMTPEGYVYSWGGEIGWPFPKKDDDKDGVNDYDTRHFTTNPSLILGAWRMISWTRDDNFAAKMLPRVRLAMDYMLKQLKGESGLIVPNSKWHTGRDKGIGSNYWDILPFGGKDAYCNIYFIASLDAMKEIERYAALRKLKADGTVRSAEAYRKLAVKARDAYRRAFWSENNGRFVGCVDIDGKTHDYGFTWLNLEAAAYDIPTAKQSARIFKWLENAVTSSGKKDVYSRWVFAPRSCTVHNPKRSEPQTPVPSWWSLVWSGTDYDDQCQNGGAILYVSYFDLMARLKWLGPDNALARYREILNRYRMPDRLMGGSPLFRGEISQGGPGGTAGQVGVEGEFPESGLVPCWVFHGLMGVRPAPEGLIIKPNLPSGIKWLRCRNVCYAGSLYTIEIRADRVIITRQADGKRISGKCDPDAFKVDLQKALWR